jgi:hypothetical protein
MQRTVLDATEGFLCSAEMTLTRRKGYLHDGSGYEVFHVFLALENGPAYRRSAIFERFCLASRRCGSSTASDYAKLQAAPDI